MTFFPSVYWTRRVACPTQFWYAYGTSAASSPMVCPCFLVFIFILLFFVEGVAVVVVGAGCADSIQDQSLMLNDDAGQFDDPITHDNFICY